METEQHRTDREWIRNGYGTDTKREQNGYKTGTERIQYGYRMGMRTCVEQKQNAFCQAFPVRLLLIGTVTWINMRVLVKRPFPFEI